MYLQFSAPKWKRQEPMKGPLVLHGACAACGLLATVAAKKRTWLICAEVIPVGSELPPDPRLSFDLLTCQPLYVIAYRPADALPRTEIMCEPLQQWPVLQNHVPVRPLVV